MAVINFNRSAIIPSRKLLWDAFLIGVATTFVIFITEFFSIDFFLNILPTGFRMIAYVAIGVYLKSLFDVRGGTFLFFQF